MRELSFLPFKSGPPFQLQKSQTVAQIQGFQHYWISEELLMSSIPLLMRGKIFNHHFLPLFPSFSTDHRSDENPPVFKPSIAPNSLESGKLRRETSGNCRKRKARIFNIELHIGTKCCQRLWCLRDNVTPTEGSIDLELFTATPLEAKVGSLLTGTRVWRGRGGICQRGSIPMSRGRRQRRHRKRWARENIKSKGRT